MQNTSYYFYGIDEDFGPFFLKFCTYFPYNAKLCINGHEYVKRQLAKEGIPFEAQDNGVLSCAIPLDCSNSAMDARLTSRRAAPEVADAHPSPLHAEDRAAGYRYDIRSFRLSSP